MTPFSGTPDEGFHEIVFIVENLERVVADYKAVFGYELLWRGDASPDLQEFLGTHEAVSSEALIGDPRQGRGFIRLIQLARPGPIMRDGAQPWDVGGVFDLNIRPLIPIEDLYARLQGIGFQGFAPITPYDFSGMLVKEVVARGHDGVVIALIERTDPPLEGYDHVSGPASCVFNSTQTVASLKEAKAFYEGALGWKPVFESAWTHPGDGSNCIGLPLNLARTQHLKVGVWQANGLNEGSVEVLEVEGIEGRNCAPRCRAPNRGILALRFPVSDLASIVDAALDGGATLLAAPRSLRVEPYGMMTCAAVETAWGARLEFLQS